MPSELLLTTFPAPRGAHGLPATVTAAAAYFHAMTMQRGLCTIEDGTVTSFVHSSADP